MKEVNEFQFTEDTTTIKTLGLYWNPSWNPVKDIFQFKINVNDDELITKRKFLSSISRIFDPLGWLSLLTISLKIMFQQLWTEKIDWDDELSNEFKFKWLKHRSRLPDLESISIPRYYMFTHDHPSVEIHAFCDASELAYSMVLYFRTIDETNTVHVRLIAAKTRLKK